MTIEIGFAFETPCGPMQSAKEGALELFPDAVSQRRLPDLAGPNDTLQFIADASDWLKVCFEIYGNELIKEMAKETWKERAKIARKIKNATVTPVQKIITALGWMKNRNGATATIAVRTESHSSLPGIDIPSSDDDEIAWRIYMMAVHAAAIKKHVEGLAKSNDRIIFEQNPDMRTIRVVPNDDGSVTISWKVAVQPETDDKTRSIPCTFKDQFITIKSPSVN